MYEDQVLHFLNHNIPGGWSPYDVPSPCPVWRHQSSGLLVHVISLRKAPRMPQFYQELSLIFMEQQIPLVHLWEDIWCCRKEQVQARLRVLCGFFDRLHARDTEARAITSDDARPFLDAHNLYGATRSRFRYGLFLEGNLVATAIFGGRRIKKNPEREVASYELIRYASLNGVRVAGGLGKLLAAFIRDQQPGDIMTYIDLDWGTGASLNQLGFRRVSVTSPRHYLVDVRTMHRQSFPRAYYHGATAVPASEPDLAPRDFSGQITASGFLKVYNAGSIKYIREFPVLKSV